MVQYGSTEIPRSTPRWAPQEQIVKPEVLGPIREVFGSASGSLQEHSIQRRTITSENVYQESNQANRAIIHRILDELLLPGSGLIGPERMNELQRLSDEGKSCLILMEHYSNFDIPCLYYLMEKNEQKAIADSIISIAGMKLNEESKFVNAFAEAYTRLVIYPSRSLQQHEDSENRESERQRSRHINMAATRQMIRLKHEGRLILVFPSGTRYREGQPDTKRGVKEVDSYLKLFDYTVFIGIAGNVLRLDPEGDMTQDLAARDLVVVNVTGPFACESIREAARATMREGEDPKQRVADEVMARLEAVHEEAAQEREARLS